MTEQPIALKTTLRGLWRRRLLVGGLALVGLAGGLFYAVSHPENPRAAVLVILPPSAVTNTGVPARDMKTQIVVATSNPVLAAAGHAVTPPVSVSGLRRAVSVEAVSDQVLQFQVSAPRARDAVALANAVAASYIHFVGQVVPSAAAGDPAQVLQPAVSALPASQLHTPVTGGIGMGAGLLVGLLLAVALSNRDRRLRSRDEISRAIGVPVLASLEATPCRTVAHWQKLLAEFVPPPAVAWVLLRLLHRIAPASAEHGQEVRVIALAEDRAALAAAAQLARAAVTLGMRTALVPDDSPAMIPLRAACAVPAGSNSHAGLLTPHPGGMAGDATELEYPDKYRDGPELTVSLLAVDRSNPELPAFSGPNLVAISAGFATSDDLARLALAAADKNQSIDGLLVVNPEPTDATAGTVGDGDRQQVISRASRSPGVDQPATRAR